MIYGFIGGALISGIHFYFLASPYIRKQEEELRRLKALRG